MKRKPYPSDVTDEEWALVAPYLTLMTEDAPQRTHSLREVFNALRWLVRAGATWRLMPHDLPPWEVVYQQTQRWLRAGVFQAIAHDLRGRALLIKRPSFAGATRSRIFLKVCPFVCRFIFAILLTSSAEFPSRTYR